MKNKTPEEAWNGSDARRSKLEDKSNKCILLGVSDIPKGYRMYNPIEGKIAINRDDVFQGNEKWNWDGKHQPEVAAKLDWGAVNSTYEDEQESEATEEESDTNSEPWED